MQGLSRTEHLQRRGEERRALSVSPRPDPAVLFVREKKVFWYCCGRGNHRAQQSLGVLGQGTSDSCSLRGGLS